MASVKVRPTELKKLKQKGSKVIGYVPNGYMPEELVYACGAIPLGLIRGGDHETVIASETYFFRFLDTFCRSQIGYRSLGKETSYQLPDLIVVPITDRNITTIADSWELYTDVAVFRFGVPRYIGVEHGLEYYIDGLKLLKQKLEEITGTEITSERLKEEIKLSNRINQLLNEISFTRIFQPPLISGKDFIRLNHASYYADRHVLLSTLESISDDIKKSTYSLDAGPRIMFVGSTLADGDYKVVDLLERFGDNIVIEEFSEGIRQYQWQIETSGDPIRNLADAYLEKRIPPALFHNVINERFDYLIKLIKEFQVNGVVWYSLMYRDCYDREGLLFSQVLEKDVGIPLLKISSDYDAAETGQMHTSIETFIEMVKQRR
ncbi:MAG: 2-hydroxyacyl-CoA dehydratase family protein [Dehalococcoidales bacterium]|nr:2-hydroxyacyl-CoA dehydratase family protein [Dehalococcoidales bacterium]